jgi:hypothetical protein
VVVRVGDGTTTVFLTDYPISKAPTVEVNLNGAGYVAKTVGIGPEGVVDSGKDYFWNAGKNEVVQASGATKLRGPTGTIDLIRITYVGQFPVVVLSTNDVEVTAQLTREAGFGTGYVEAVASDSSIKTLSGAYQSAGGYLARYGKLGKRLKFRTIRGDLMPGQLLSASFPVYQLNGDQLLVESVDVTFDGYTVWYDVSAVAGPINQTWPEYFKALTSKQATVDKINLGSGNTLATLQTFTATKAPTASFVATAQACLFPTTTQYPTTSSLPC